MIKQTLFNTVSAKTARPSFRLLALISFLFLSTITFATEIRLELGQVQNSWWSAMWTIEPAPDGSNYKRIKNYWKKTFIHNEVTDPLTEHTPDDWHSAMWELKQVDNTKYYRLKNRHTSQYLHSENGKLEIGNIDDNWLSAMWEFEKVGAGDYVRIKNRRTGEALHNQHQIVYPDYRNPYSNVHGAFNWPNATQGVEYLEMEITLKVEYASPDYFWSYKIYFQNDEGGYFGLQSKSAGYSVQFSLWNSLAAEKAPNGTANAFDHENSGYACSIPYAWRVGQTYKLMLKRTRRESTGDWWTASIIDVKTGQATTAGSIKTPRTWGGLKAQSTNFVESFSKQDSKYHTCGELQYTRAILEMPVMTDQNGNRHRASSQSYVISDPCKNQSAVSNFSAAAKIIETGLSNKPAGTSPAPAAAHSFSVSNKSVWLISYRIFTKEVGWSSWENVNTDKSASISQKGLVTNYQIQYKDVLTWKNIPATPVLATQARNQSFSVSGNTFTGIKMK